MTDAELPLATRLWFAWLCFFWIFLDSRFAARLWSAREAPALPPPAAPAAPPAQAAPPRPPAEIPALQMLSLFQREGRLIDFLLMFAVGADAGDGHELGQAANESAVVLRQPIQYWLHGSLLMKEGNRENVSARGSEGK